MGAKSLYLTFDDGPSRPYTPQILELLNLHGAKATFFVCGKNAEIYPEIVRQIADSGHALGNHAYSHSWRKTFSLSLAEEFDHTDAVIKKITGVETKLLRPPWGLIRSSIRKNLEARGFKFVFWDVQAYDWWQPPVSFIEKRVISNVRPGSVILLHDGQKTNQGKNRTSTLAALPKILQTLQVRGYQFENLK
jgi:peptidoglycan/xylan/chitin deacetylase (PgdA/CDA1 family)